MGVRWVQGMYVYECVFVKVLTVDTSRTNSWVTLMHLTWF